jgi:hypothetical protein
MRRGHNSSPGAVGSLVSCWRAARPSGASSNGADRRLAAGRSPSPVPVTLLVAGWDDRGQGSGGDRIRGKVIFAVGFEGLLPLSFMEYDHAIKTFSTKGTDQALAEGILPWRSRGEQLLLDAQALGPPREDRAVDGMAVPQQISRRRVVGRRRFGWWPRLAAFPRHERRLATQAA